MQKIAKELLKKTIIYIKQSWSNGQIFGVFFAFATSPPPFETRPHSHLLFTMLMHVFRISGVLCQILMVHYQEIKQTKDSCKIRK